MTHGDDAGLVCPPRLAQYQVVIVPIYRTGRGARRRAGGRGSDARASWWTAGIRAHLDAREGMKPGAKYYEWEGRGAPLRLELGPRDLAAGTAMLARRTGGKKEPLPDGGLAAGCAQKAGPCSPTCSQAARDRREAASMRGANREQFLEFIDGAAAGSSTADAAGDAAARPRSRSRPRRPSGSCPIAEFRSAAAPDTCIWCGGPSVAEAVWAKAY